MAQGLEVKRNFIFQDDESGELLEVNGKKSSSKRTRHINFRYFLVTDAIIRRSAMSIYGLSDKGPARRYEGLHHGREYVHVEL
jgi:hypothetical protein